MRYKNFFVTVVVFFSLVICVSTASGQGITTGSITGTVTDQTGAVVSNAEITATDIAKGTTIKAASQSSGVFAFHAVPIGTYKLRVSASGFSPGNIDSVVVVSGVTTDLKSVELSITATESVIITGNTSPLLQISDSQVSTTFSGQTLENSPLNNAFDTVAEVIPGVVSTHADNFSNTNGDNFSVNGQSGRYNNFEFDGQSDNDNTIGGPQIFFGNQDAIAEIQIITDDFSAQYGRNSGAVINYLTKSGTNEFHGSGFEYYQGQFLSSFENQEKSSIFGFCAPGQNPNTGCAVPVLPRSDENRYGGTLGGPILKDKLFFFGSTYWDRQRSGVSPSTSTTLTPTPAGIAQLASTFPGNAAVAALQTTGPYAIPVGNPAPVGAITPENITGPGGVTATNVPFSFVQRLVASPYNDQEHLGRIDWQPTDRDHLFARYFYQNLVLAAAAGDIPSGGYTNSTDTVHTIGADWSHTFSDTWVDQLRYSFQQATGAFDGGGFSNCTISAPNVCPAQVTINSGFESLGLNTDFPQGRVVKVTQVQDNAIWTHGRHIILFGGEVDYQNSPQVGLFNYGGVYTFNDFSNFISQAPGAGQPISNAQVALADGDFTTKYKETDVATYIQDDWKVSPTFTAHIGLRWEYFSPSFNVLHDESVARESNPATAFWSPSLPLADRTFPAIQQYVKGFEPRLGFSWNPGFDSKLVVKAGYAINENPAFYNIGTNVQDTAPISNAGVVYCTGDATCIPSNGSISYSSVRGLNLASLPRGGDPRMRDQTTVPQNLRPPYTQTYTLALDHQVGSAAVAEIRYVGSLTQKNFQSVDANPDLLPVQTDFPNFAPVTLCDTPGATGFGRPNCNFGNVSTIGNGAWSNYNGLQTNLTTRDLHGVTGTISYTFSKSLDNATDAFRSTGSGGSSIAYAQNPLNTDSGERGVSGNSITHVLGAQLTYQLPNFVKSNGLLSRVANGYVLSGVYRYNSGQPYTPYQSIGLDSFTPDTSYCDGTFNSSSVAVGVDTCRLVRSNKSAPLGTVAYLNPYTGPVVNGSPTLGTPVYVAYGSDSTTTDANGNVTGYNPGTPIDPTKAHWIVNNMAYAQAVGNPYPGSARSVEHGDNFSEMDATILKTLKVTERVNVQLSMAAFNVLNQMYRGAPQTFVANTATFGSYDYSSPSAVGGVPGNTTQSGQRFVLLGGKVRF
ncbi:hypothetical protein HNQ77_003579 [Silvibacterium bohemicum]|uniref:TonB-dependent receptor plug domain-containing protein n=1 Tax=Silvibacterium bohemicum TaxID=1577686 RepID=A0A841K4T0_9BACT|nr:carboxypeptidase regulatory-like domain-containing protein [Silvibacterium bohemicum]MBB6145618.1 hypothetical protein [Silvibacterium bohemicum]